MANAATVTKTRVIGIAVWLAACVAAVACGGDDADPGGGFVTDSGFDLPDGGDAGGAGGGIAPMGGGTPPVGGGFAPAGGGGGGVPPIGGGGMPPMGGGGMPPMGGGMPPDPAQTCNDLCTHIAGCLSPICPNLDRSVLRDNCAADCAGDPPSSAEVDALVALGCERTNQSACAQQADIQAQCNCSPENPDAAVDEPDAGVSPDPDAGMVGDDCNELNDMCVGESVCVRGHCVQAFGRLYDVVVEHYTVELRMGDDDCWDINCGSPDVYTEVVLDGRIVDSTRTQQDSFEGDFSDEPMTIRVLGGSEIEIKLWDSDLDFDDEIVNCRAALSAPFLRGREFMCENSQGLIQGTIEPH